MIVEYDGEGNTPHEAELDIQRELPSGASVLSYETTLQEKPMAIYTVEPGRVIAKDGTPIITIGRVEAPAYGSAVVRHHLDPADADALTHRIVAMLNKGEEP